MQYDKDTLIKYRIERAKETIEEARDAIINNHPFNAANRVYYAIFYIVSALAIKNNFSTTKHSQLLGWFNKNFVKTNIVSEKSGSIYFSAFQKRQKGDYDDFSDIALEDIKEDFEIMITFVKEIEALIYKADSNER